MHEGRRAIVDKPELDLSEVTPEIVLMTVHDREHKNTFSIGLMDALTEAFATVGEGGAYKVVVLTGYDTYFLMGGTREQLLALSQTDSVFTDRPIHSLALECRIPVISAMQGHSFGGGFTTGLYADLVVLSRESVYAANFMDFGFTPGMGSTCVYPRKFGIVLAEEMLMTGRRYRGAELEQRGAPFPVKPRAEVVSYALERAREIAEKPREALITLKDHLVADMRRDLPAIIEAELEMHRRTFHESHVPDRINDRYGL